MSEPLINHDIEDVVSSIRRLVSTELRPRTRDLSHDKLLLTPALRVVSDSAQVPQDVPEAAAAVVPEPVEVAPVAEATTTDQAPLILEVAEIAETSDAPVVAPPVIDAEWEDKIWEEPEPTLAALAEVTEEAELVQFPVPEAAPAEATAEAAAEPEMAGEQPIAFHSHPRVVSRTLAAEAGEIDNIVAEPAGPAADPEATGEEPGFSLMDEDVLSEMIRDLIREELQGALGERITRNVRKLVRAEINRALASRAYE